MFVKSIRWRLQAWFAFLLLCLLSGFGFTTYQLNRINRFGQLDEELDQRVTLLSGDVRGRFPFPPPGKAPGAPPPWDLEGGPRPFPKEAREHDRHGPGPWRDFGAVIRNVTLSP